MNGKLSLLTMDDVRQRLSERGVNGIFLPFGSGLETDAELKSLIMLIVGSRHHDRCGEACFFGNANKLYPDSLTLAVYNFSRKLMLQILEEECACRNQQNSP